MITLTYAIMLFFQILNNKYATFLVPWLSVGKISTLIFLLYGFSLLSKIGNKISNKEKFLLVIVYFYVFSQIISIFFTLNEFQALKNIFTLSVQSSLVFLLIVLWRPNWSNISINVLIVLAVVLSLVNCSNAIFPNINLFRVRESFGRDFYLIHFYSNRVVSFTNIYGQFAGFLLIGGFLFIDKILNNFSYHNSAKNKVLILIAISIVLFGMMSLQSRGTFIAFLFSLFLYSFNRFGKFSKLILFLSVILFLGLWGLSFWEKLISVKSSTFYGRLNASYDAFDMILNNPFGVAKGGFRAFTGNVAVLHNTYLEAFVTGGYISGLAFLIFIFSPICFLWKYRNNKNYCVNALISGYTANLIILAGYNGLTEYQYFIYPVLAIKISKKIMYDTKSLHNLRR